MSGDALALLSPTVALADDGTTPVEPDVVEPSQDAQAATVVTIDDAQVQDFVTFGGSLLALQMVSTAVLLAVLGAIIGRQFFEGLRT